MTHNHTTNYSLSSPFHQHTSCKRYPWRRRTDRQAHVPKISHHLQTNQTTEHDIPTLQGGRFRQQKNSKLIRKHKRGLEMSAYISQTFFFLQQVLPTSPIQLKFRPLRLCQFTFTGTSDTHESYKGENNTVTLSKNRRKKTE